MAIRTATVTTPDGICPVTLHYPEGEGPWPGLLMYMDAPGIRPALHEIADRLAASGYAVLLPDLFYRSGPYPPVDPVQLHADPALRAAHRDKFMAPLTPEASVSDAGALLDFLSAQPEVAPGPIGTFGYCMGGRLALLTAGQFPDRIAASASFHPGGLVTDVPMSPHRFAGRIKARVYVAGATDDPSFPAEMRERLVEALSQAGVTHTVETYPARHGWVPRDTAAHDPAEAEHHWQALVQFLDGALKPA